ncbi:MAG: hypothetical protein AB7G39_07425 [Alphaproteobacteria bacterium]
MADRILSIVAYAVFAFFMVILIVKVHEPALWAVLGVCMVLAAVPIWETMRNRSDVEPPNEIG